MKVLALENSYIGMVCVETRTTTRLAEETAHVPTMRHHLEKLVYRQS